MTVQDDENATPTQGKGRGTARHVRRGPPGDVRALTRELWFGIRRVTRVLDDEDAPVEHVLRALNSLAVASNVYLRALEAGDIHEQVAEMYADFQQRKGQR